MKIIKTFTKLLFWACVLASLLLLSLWLLHSPTDLINTSKSKEWLEQGDFDVEKERLTIIDTDRETPAMGGFKGDRKRTLKGNIWFPKGKSGDLPLIVYSHGFGGQNNESRHIANYLARNGYVVASVNFPLSTMRSPADVPQLLDVANQPGDVSAVINHVLQLNQDSNSALFQRIDESSIGAMGLSLGGLTTALVSYHPKLKDNRIKASVMMAPPLEAFNNQFFESNPELNSLLISGSMDRVVPEQKNATNVMKRHARGWFISIDKGTHLGFANIGNPLRWMDNPDDLGCQFMDMMLSKLELPERWNAALPDSDDVLRDIKAGTPCPTIDGKSLNGLRQQWLTRISIGSFFDLHLREGPRAKKAREFLLHSLASENQEITLTTPR